MKWAFLKIPINLIAYSLEGLLIGFLLIAYQGNLDKCCNGYLVLRSLTKRIFIEYGINPTPYSFQAYLSHLLRIKL